MHTTTGLDGIEFGHFTRGHLVFQYGRQRGCVFTVFIFDKRNGKQVSIHNWINTKIKL